MVPFPYVLETILAGDEEEEEEEEEEQVNLQGITWLARAAELQRRSTMGTLPSTQEEPSEVSSLEDKVQQWVDEQSEESEDIFKMLDFDFMPMGTKLAGDKIKDTPIRRLDTDAARFTWSLSYSPISTTSHCGR